MRSGTSPPTSSARKSPTSRSRTTRDASPSTPPKTPPVNPEDKKKDKPRRMDCIDCHNRPTHIYQPPDKAVDDLLTAGRLDPSLPFIKKYAVEVLTKQYKTTEEGLDAIATDLDSTYMTKHPDVYAKKLPAIKQ